MWIEDFKSKRSASLRSQRGTEPRWKRFEALAFEIQKSLSPDATVKLNDTIQGVNSGESRQIDISVRQKVGQFEILIVLECKDLLRRVGVSNVEAFIEKLKDVRASKGAIISSRGFSKGAVNLARNKGVETLRLVDVESVDWHSFISLPTLFVRSHMKTSRFVFSSSQMPPHEISLALPGDEAMNFLGLDKDETSLGPLKYLVARKWNDGTIPNQKGEYKIPLTECGSVEHCGERWKCEIAFSVVVEETRYFGWLRLEQLKGFHDVQKGGIVTKQLTTQTYSPYEIETGKVPGWIILEAGQEPPVSPFMTEFYSDAPPASEAEEIECS